jgi:CelD/BcsL family acetyltransferase involved in cellulose biosynthesis
MLMPKELLHFSTISLNKQIISWRIGFLYKDIYYSYMPVFETNYAKFSPSKVHLLMNVEEFIKSNRNIKVYDLMRGAKAYKDSFATNSKKVFSYQLQNTTLISRLKIKLVELKNALKN